MLDANNKNIVVSSMSNILNTLDVPLSVQQLTNDPTIAIFISNFSFRYIKNCFRSISLDLKLAIESF